MAILEQDLGYVHIDTSASMNTPYTGSSKHEFVCITMAAVRIDTSYVRSACSGYLRISLVRAVSVQVVFLSNPYEVNNTKVVLN